jgi:hypothetical protein
MDYSYFLEEDDNTKKSSKIKKGAALGVGALGVGALGVGATAAGITIDILKKDFNRYKKLGGYRTFKSYIIQRKKGKTNSDLIEEEKIEIKNSRELKDMEEEKKPKRRFSESLYDSINGEHITDVFDNFEDKFSNDNTTELTTFKDMEQRRGFPSNDFDHKKINLMKAIYERDKHNSINQKVFDKMNYLREEQYCDLYLEGYYDALVDIS